MCELLLSSSADILCSFSVKEHQNVSNEEIAGRKLVFVYLRGKGERGYVSPFSPYTKTIKSSAYLENT